MHEKRRTPTPPVRRLTIGRRRRVAGALLGAALAALLLTTCGGGSSSTSSTATNASSSPAKRLTARATALRACLQRNGVTLPSRGGGQSGPFGPDALAKGVTPEQLRAAMSKCSGGLGGGRRFGGARNAQRLEQFAACMQQNGVHLPAPNATGKGPVFDTKGIDRTSATFKKADAKCARKLFTRAGGPPNGPGAGAPAG